MRILFVFVFLLGLVSCGEEKNSSSSSKEIKAEKKNTQKRYYANELNGTNILSDKNDNLITGIVYDEFDNGKIKYEYNYKKGIRNGKQIDYLENGKKSKEFHMKNGEKHGSFKWWRDESETLFLKRNYINNELDSIETMYFKNGKHQFETSYKFGKRNGYDFEWYENGKIKAKHLYINGLKNDTTTYWYINGKKQKEYYYKDDEMIGGKTWFSDGTPKDKNKWFYKQYKEDGTYKVHSYN